MPFEQQLPSGHLVWPSHLSEMSPVVRQRFPTAFAQSQGRLVPHSQMLKTMGRPEASSAARMIS